MKRWTKLSAALLIACLVMTGCGTDTSKEGGDSKTGGRRRRRTF